MPTKRLLVAETIDPSSRLPQWVTPAIRRIGWESWTLPTLEAVRMYGNSTYASMVVEIVDELRPHVLLVNPPYDHLHMEACRQIRDRGVRIIGLAFDDPRFQDTWGEREFADLSARFDLWATTAVEGPTVTAGAKPVLWAMAPESVNIDDPQAPAYEVVMIGSYTEERQLVARTVAKSGFKIACFGHGWAAGSISRPSRLGLMRRAKYVIVPSDGADFAPVYMTEAALLGAHQIVELVPGLERYWPEFDGPATYVTAEECVQRLTQEEPLKMWTKVPTWDELWPELIDSLSLAVQPECTRSPTLEFLYASLARLYGKGGRLRAATACLLAWAEANPGDPGPKVQLARYASVAHNWEDTVRLTAEAEQALRPYVTQAVANQRVCSIDPRTGAIDALDPSLELVALRLHALLKTDKIDEVLEEVKKMPRARRRALLAIIQPELGNTDFSDFLTALTVEDESDEGEDDASGKGHINVGRSSMKIGSINSENSKFGGHNT